MGQCYFVEARLRFPENDPEGKGFCVRVRREIELRSGRTAHFADFRGDWNTPFGCFMNLTTSKAEESDGWMWAEFDASYGWYSVMSEIFLEAAKHLGDGSFISIRPESGCEEITVEDGKIRSVWIDDPEDETWEEYE